MAIQPIDLQTLFTQIDKVGKSQAEQREGLAIQQSLQSVQMQKKNDIRNESVNESRDPGEEGAERVRDRNAENSGGETERERKKREEDAEDLPLPVIKDTSVGKIIDLSG
ncbi:MAG: hypothetical protein LBK64_06650 [Spirochaetaceae bacterium]|jgi:hypothetical protein|nr:hypothetical protein [Spirochaetaceae bacterium]